MIRRRQIDNSIEENIITGLVISTKYCRDIQQIIRSEYFIVPHAKIISKWCIDYFKQYKQAPEGHIQDIYEVEKGKLKSEEADLIAIFLAKLSNQYESESKFNSEYLYDRTVPYFKKRSLKIISSKIDSLVELDRIDEAEKEVSKYSKVLKETSKWFDPFDETGVKNYFQDKQNNVNVLFQFPGEVGNMIGPFQRDWLVGILSPTKRGKSWLLLEMAIQAVMERLRTVFISLEMSKFEIKERIYKRITAFGEEKREYVYPTFDCKKNQDGSCNKPERENSIKLLNEAGEKPQFDFKLKYRTCIACRGTRDFFTESWFTNFHREKMKFGNTNKIIKAMKQMYGDNFRAIAYPEYEANVSTFKSDLDMLEQYDNFIPDVIIPDYADIFAPEDSRVVGRDRIDETWKALKNMAGTRHCLVATGSQSNRVSFDKKNVTAIDAAEDIRKIAHSNMFLALNQVPEEKKAGILRMAKIIARSSDFDPLKSCVILQNFELGQTLLDSEIGNIKYEKKGKDK